MSLLNKAKKYTQQIRNRFTEIENNFRNRQNEEIVTESEQVNKLLRILYPSNRSAIRDGCTEKLRKCLEVIIDHPIPRIRHERQIERLNFKKYQVFYVRKLNKCLMYLDRYTSIDCSHRSYITDEYLFTSLSPEEFNDNLFRPATDEEIERFIQEFTT